MSTSRARGDRAGDRSGWSLVRPEDSQAGVVAGWTTSAEETRRWCSSSEHPVPAAVVRSWWEEVDVQARLLLDPDGMPVAYGEVWDDETEDEQELARIVVDPSRRRQGVGHRLVRELLALPRAGPRSAVVVRVVPTNHGALLLYRRCGFRDVDHVTAGEWNQGQPTTYCWLVLSPPPDGT